MCPPQNVQRTMKYNRFVSNMTQLLNRCTKHECHFVECPQCICFPYFCLCDLICFGVFSLLWSIVWLWCGCSMERCKRLDTGCPRRWQENSFIHLIEPQQCKAWRCRTPQAELGSPCEEMIRNDECLQCQCSGPEIVHQAELQRYSLPWTGKGGLHVRWGHWVCAVISIAVDS